MERPPTLSRPTPGSQVPGSPRTPAHSSTLSGMCDWRTQSRLDSFQRKLVSELLFGLFRFLYKYHLTGLLHLFF